MWAYILCSFKVHLILLPENNNGNNWTESILKYTHTNVIHSVQALKLLPSICIKTLTLHWISPRATNWYNCDLYANNKTHCLSADCLDIFLIVNNNIVSYDNFEVVLIAF